MAWNFDFASWIRKKARIYTDSVALNGVPVQYPTVNPITQTWRMFDPTIPGYVETPYTAIGQIPQPGDNGNWWIGGNDTGYPSRGENGETPEIRVENNVLQVRYPSDPPGVWTDLYEIPVDTYTHTQNTAAAVWTIPHNLDHQFVGVRVNDFTGTEMLPEITYTSANVVTLGFAAPRQGIAQISK